jgi:hypothetical protein
MNSDSSIITLKVSFQDEAQVKCRSLITTSAHIMPGTPLIVPFHNYSLEVYRNTIAGSSHDERIFIYFEKIRFVSQKHNFSIFVF